jgi:hypothetical protein
MRRWRAVALIGKGRRRGMRLDDSSQMSREGQVRFCESTGVRYHRDSTEAGMKLTATTIGSLG